MDLARYILFERKKPVILLVLLLCLLCSACSGTMELYEPRNVSGTDLTLEEMVEVKKYQMQQDFDQMMFEEKVKKSQRQQAYDQ